MEKRKCNIKCSYALLVIILFACVAFLTDYIIIGQKICESDNKGQANNEVIANSYEQFSKGILKNRNSFFEHDSLYRTNIDNNGISYSVELSKDGNLTVIFNDDHSYDSRFIASEVLNYYVISYGNGGFNGLYFIYEDGSVGFSAIESDYLNNIELSVSKIEGLKNIVTIVSGSYSDELSGYRGPVYIDIDGNMYK